MSIELKDFLDRKVKEYNRPPFIIADPVSIPHSFTQKQDIEISGFFAAVFAWGNRTTIIQKCKVLMQLMDNSPYDFVLHHREKDLRRFEEFSHRTFNATDILYFISFFQHHYKKFTSFEDAFIPFELGDRQTFVTATGNKTQEPIEISLNFFNRYFFSLEDVPHRTRKHIACPSKNSACKRLNMYLRWMVRKDKNGVDFGLWRKIKPQHLVIPLDLHVARVARKFRLLDRPNADWLSAIELTRQLRKFDPDDPAKYDFALFALGVIEKF